LGRLDKAVQKQILRYLETRIAAAEHPQFFGKPLQGQLRKLWRYRVGDYRVLCDIQDHRLTVLVISVGHRRNVYLQ
jgi:mRNA interferase RelE/StbE